MSIEPEEVFLRRLLQMSVPDKYRSWERCQSDIKSNILARFKSLEKEKAI